MASIKAIFRPSTVSGQKGTVYYRIIHERKVRHLPTGYKVHKSEFNHIDTKEKIHRDIERLERIARILDSKGSVYTSGDIIDEFRRYTGLYSIFNYMESIIALLKSRNKTRTAETYKTTLNRFKQFRMGEDIMLDAITHDLIESFEAHLQEKGNTPNTTSFYMRILRATYNRAVQDNIIDNRSPFRRVYTGIEKTMKRALPLTVMKKIKALDLPPTTPADYARDMFLMSFFLRGMSFIDMAFLRKTDLTDNHIYYRRRKTGQPLKIAWTKEMQEILDKYPENPTRYLLPIITVNAINERQIYRYKSYSINRQLKNIAAMIKITSPLTLYCARHSWASAAKAKGIPLSIISEGMGHDSETTTRIYLASLDTTVIDKANSMIIKSL